MSFKVRLARGCDLQQFYEMAKLTGSGFTNLPPERRAISAKIERTEAACARGEDEWEDDLFLLALENCATRKVRGTAQLFTKVGQLWPFYSYRISTLTQHSKELDRTFRAEMLSLTTDLEGSSEVGGLFVHPNERAGGLGLLLARSRYLFIRTHRGRFGDRILAELRGIIDEAGGSPFWDGLGGRFFGMSFQEADYFNAIHGNQFIADLMPKHPIYTAMLSDSARAVIGLPHPSGRAAMRMLEQENFVYENYIDIFDAGPTMTARTDQVRSIAGARQSEVLGISSGGTRSLGATGHLCDWRCTYLDIAEQEGGVLIDEAGAETLGVGKGDAIWHVAR